MAVELYKHNKIAYDKVQKMFESQNRAAVVHPTGCGKSFISLKWLEENRNKKAIFLAPTISILQQIEKHIIDCGMTMSDFPHLRGITYSKLCRMSESDIQKLNFDMIVLDEFHRCGADEWSKGIATLINNNTNAKILGFSATPIRYLDEHRNMAEELFHGNVASEITLEDAMIDGILPMPTYINAVYSFKEDIEYYQEKIEKEKRLEEKLKAQQFLEDAKKILEKADGLPQIFKKHIKNKSGKYIVFCRNQEHMQSMMQEAKTWFKEVNDNVEMYSMASFIPRKENLKVFEEFYNSNNDSLKLLFSIDMLNEGVHVPNIDGVIMLRPTESPIIFKQQLGRALSVGHNSNPIVFDIVNNVQSCEMIDKFYQELRVRALVKFTQTGSKEDEAKIGAFQISDTIRQIEEIFSKIDNCLKLSWDDYYKLAVDYYNEHENLLVPVNYSKNGMNLGYWITDQRKTMKGLGHRKNLTDEQIQKLDAIGMVWDKFKEQWEETYDIAKSWYEEHGNLEGLKDIKIQGKNIYQWLGDQIKSYNKGTLSEKRISLLEDIGIIWNKNETRWQDMYELAKQYYKEYGTLSGVKDEKLKNWLQVQRQAYKGKSTYTPLTDEQIELLEKIGIVWDSKEKGFADMFELARQYYEEHGNLLLPDKYKIDGKNLSGWVKDKRKAYKNGTLSKEQIEMLESIGMIWAVNEYKWNNMYSLAKEYYEEHGNLFLTPSINKQLYAWLKIQKKLYEQGERLTEEQRFLLDQIEIRNGVSKPKQKIKCKEKSPRKSLWHSMYIQAKEYYEGHGNLLVSNEQENIKLHTWIKNQRKKYNSGSLSEEQISMLDSIGMIWNTIEYQWNTMYEQARDYYQKFGSLSIPDDRTDEYKRLRTWIQGQKMKYNHESEANLTDEQIQKLESIGIVWNVNQESYDRMFQQAKEYYEQFGDLMVPRNDEFKTLSSWVKSMRKKYKENKLTPEQITILESIGMVWDAKQFLWDTMYEQAKEYYEEHGNLSIPRDSEEHKKLSTWITNKKSGYYGKGSCKLTDEQVLQLQAIGLLLENTEDDYNSKLEYIQHQKALLNVLKEVLLQCKNNGLENTDIIYDETTGTCRKRIK